MIIPFNIPCSVGTGGDFIKKALANGHISANGQFTKKCQEFFESRLDYRKTFLTNSCTSALEMAAILCNIKPGDEVAMPSFTHVGTANAFIRAGAKIVFVDSLPDHPNMDPVHLASMTSRKTKVIVPVHYAGVACDMNAISRIARKNGSVVVEDAAQAVGARYQGKSLGSFGSFAAISFHETKNITSGTGGLLVVNEENEVIRASQIWHNGTNRAEFEARQVDHYSWTDMGSSFGLSDLNAAFLYAQLLDFMSVMRRRRDLWDAYFEMLKPGEERGLFRLPAIPADAEHNHHIFYLRFPDRQARDLMIRNLATAGIQSVFHYIPLHSSPFFASQYTGAPLPNCQKISETILRLPLYHSLTKNQVEYISSKVLALSPVPARVSG